MKVQSPILSILTLLCLTMFAAGCEFGYNCTYPCHCESQAVCNVTNGDCPGGCDDGDRNGHVWRGAWSGPGCQVGNVAYLNPASQAPTTNSDNEASRAVNGNINPNMAQDQCSYTQTGDSSNPAWWEVDLGQEHVIYNVSIFTRDSWRNRYGGTQVAVKRSSDGQSQTCGTVGISGEDYNRDVIDVVCSEPLVGQYVTLQRTTAGIVGINPHAMFLCEVMAIGYIYRDCQSRRFGPGCLTSCNCREQCDVISGTCTAGCEAGWQGIDCQLECDNGFWGLQCMGQCRCNETDEVCYHVTGYCALSGCASGYAGIGCGAVLPILPDALVVQSVEYNSVSLQFTPWVASDEHGYEPSHYLLQIRWQGSDIWTNVLQIDNATTGNVTSDIDLEGNVTYYIRVVPVLTYEGEAYIGTAQAVDFILPAGDDPTGMDGNDAAVGIVLGVLSCILLGIVVAVVVLLILRRRNRKKRSTEPFQNTESAPTNGHVNQALTAGDEEEGSHAPLTEETEAVTMVEESTRSGSDLASPSPEPQLAGSDRVSTENYENVYSNQSFLARPIAVVDLAAQIEIMKNKDNAFRFEYLQAPSGPRAKCNIGNNTINRGKNRFNNIIAYDHSRVVLDMASGDKGEGYINANFIPGYNGNEKFYIAAQGPRAHTVNDMWHMVWKENICKIIMLTNVVEAGKVKCELYWPDKEEESAEKLGDFKIKCVKKEVFADYVIRGLSLEYQGEYRPVSHYHFLGWPDHGVPSVATSLLEFRRKLRAQEQITDGPMLVHCSAGIGRTGTFIAIDYLLDQAQAEGLIDVFKYTTLMRAYRIDMIQNLEQYIFVYTALLQALESGNTTIASHEVEDVIPALLEEDSDIGITSIREQFEVLSTLKPVIPKDDLDGLSPDNMEKNRSQAVVPSKSVRPRLRTRTEGCPDYINAAYIDGYHSRRAYIVTQLPMESTIEDFWRMLYDHNSRSVLLLYDWEKEDATCPIYWPNTENATHAYGWLQVSLLNCKDRDDHGIVEREFRIENTDKADKEPFTVKQFQLHGWSEDAELPPKTESILNLLERVERWQQRSGNRPITIQDKNGVRQCGVVCATSFLIDKLKVDQEVDVFLAVAQIRLGRPQLIHSIEQYRYLHRLAMIYVRNNSAYANFK